MDYKKLVELALLAGEIMLRNGAETYRVEDTINRILGESKLARRDAFVITTGIMITLDDPSINEITLVKRVYSRSTDLNKIAKVNDVSRKFCNQKVTLDEAYSEVETISKEDRLYGNILNGFGNISIVMSCAVMFGITGFGVVLAFFIGMWDAIVIFFSKKLRLNPFISDIITAMLAAGLIVVLESLNIVQKDVDILISASIMPLVPGVAITNAVRDTLNGDYVSGTARVLEAFVTAAAVAMGVGAGMTLMNLIIGGL